MIIEKQQGIQYKPLVSVIMNCYNSDQYLAQSIESILNQQYDNFEIIFWDNNSTDNSAAIAASYGDRRIQYFKGETTVPLGAARNLALEKVQGSLIAFLDCDDIWMPDKLEKQVSLFLADEEVGLVYSDSNYFNEKGILYNLFSMKKPYRGHCFAALLNKYIISLETAMISRRALNTLDHWFDNRFQMIEEYDLFVRIGAQWKIDYSNEILAMWRVHASSWTSKYPEKFCEEKRAMLEDLRKQSVFLIHERELDVAEDALIVEESVVLWQLGKSAEARKLLKTGRSMAKKRYLIRLISYLPYTFVHATHVRFSKLKTAIKGKKR